jgi:hypothetical protein
MNMLRYLIKATHNMSKPKVAVPIEYIHLNNMKFNFMCQRSALFLHQGRCSISGCLRYFYKMLISIEP